MTRPHAVIFDAYGTLLDVHAAMQAHAGRLGPEWPRISAEWRTKQLEYTWVRSLAGSAHHRDFMTVTRAALDFVGARHGIDDAALLQDILLAYRRLAAYPDAPATLHALQDAGIGRAVLSNGEPAMLQDAVAASGLGPLLDDVLSVEAVGIYKPAPAVYRLAADRFGVQPGEIGFVSSNPWDAFGAAAFGFRVFWINRSGQPDEYDLRGKVTELADLSALAPAILS